MSRFNPEEDWRLKGSTGRVSGMESVVNHWDMAVVNEKSHLLFGMALIT